MLYEKKYIAAFSELAHPEHFERVFESVQQAEDHLRSEYDRAAWKVLGQYASNSKLPEHYMLPKYKDVIAED